MSEPSHPRLEATPRPQRRGYQLEHQHSLQLSLQLLHPALQGGPWSLVQGYSTIFSFVWPIAGPPGEIKLSGGEPFVHPTLLEIAAGLAALQHRVGVVTNFSADESKLSRFVDACRGRVSMVSCSLHLEYVPKLEPFADKAAGYLGNLLRHRTLPCRAQVFM
jgi:hypothetical protein